MALPQGWDETRNEWRRRLRAPERFARIRPKPFEGVAGVYLVGGPLKRGDRERSRHAPGAFVPQAIRFKKSDWPSLTVAVGWFEASRFAGETDNPPLRGNPPPGNPNPIFGRVGFYVLKIREQCDEYLERLRKLHDIGQAGKKPPVKLVIQLESYQERIYRLAQLMGVEGAPLELPPVALTERLENPPRRRPTILTVPEQHRLRIAKDTLKMSDVGARIMGGMTKDEARAVIRQYLGPAAVEFYDVSAPRRENPPVMDRDTAEHFYRWLDANVRPEDQHQVEQEVHQLLRDHPDLVERGYTWTQMRELGERNYRRENPPRPMQWHEAPRTLGDLARNRVNYENGRFLVPDILALSKEERDRIDAYLVAIQHPLAFEPGDQVNRIAAAARELAGSAGGEITSGPGVYRTKLRPGAERERILREMSGWPKARRENHPPSHWYDSTEIETWFERDRQHVALQWADTGETIIEWWDDEVTQAVEDGFLSPRDWHGSALEYADELGLLKGAAGSRRIARRLERSKGRKPNPPRRVEQFREAAGDAIERLVRVETNLSKLIHRALRSGAPRELRAKANKLEAERKAAVEQVARAVARHGAAIEEFSVPTSRRENPPRASSAEKAAAVSRFEEFHGAKPEGFTFREIPDLTKLVTLGRALEVHYQAHVPRGEKNTPYRHEFGPDATLLTDATGKALVILGNIHVGRARGGRLGYIRG